jgi:hypothetical protein
MVITKKEIKLFVMTAQLMWGLVPEKEMDDFLYKYLVEEYKLTK